MKKKTIVKLLAVALTVLFCVPSVPALAANDSIGKKVNMDVSYDELKTERYFDVYRETSMDTGAFIDGAKEITDRKGNSQYSLVVSWGVYCPNCSDFLYQLNNSTLVNNDNVHIYLLEVQNGTKQQAIGKLKKYFPKYETATNVSTYFTGSALSSLLMNKSQLAKPGEPYSLPASFLLKGNGEGVSLRAATLSVSNSLAQDYANYIDELEKENAPSGGEQQPGGGSETEQPDEGSETGDQGDQGNQGEQENDQPLPDGMTYTQKTEGTKKIAEVKLGKNDDVENNLFVLAGYRDNTMVSCRILTKDEPSGKLTLEDAGATFKLIELGKNGFRYVNNHKESKAQS